jgi:choloylglycine hydrolase
LLTSFATVDEVRDALTKVRVVPVVEPALGFAPPVHFIVTEPSGKAIVIEYLKGEMKIFDAPFGVITNAPSYDWHETNLRNYINLSPVALPGKKIEDLNFRPLGGGSGMIGLPGDFTPPSRFVRAVAFYKTARPTATGDETIYEIFRILDNFNVPLGASEGTGDDKTQGMRNSTIWTSASDTNNKVFYYHTQHNRRVRMVDLKKIDFGSFSDIKRLPLDKVKAQDIQDVTPQ